MEEYWQHLERWYRQPAAIMLLEMEQALLDRVLKTVFGDFLLQLSGPCDLRLSAAANTRARLYINPVLPRLVRPALCKHYAAAHLDELPLRPNCVDAVVIVHALEFSVYPKMILQQAYDVLRPNGQLIIIGFNPSSLWGIRHFLGRRGVPWCGKFRTAFKIKHWLRQQGFRIITSKTTCFRPPISDPVWQRRLLFLEAIGQMALPGLGGVYMITAQKRELAATPLPQFLQWPRKLVLSNGQVEPVPRTRETNEQH